MHGKATGAVRSHPLQLCRERSYVGNPFLLGESRDQWETRESALIRHSWIQMVARGEDWKGMPNLRGFEMRPPRRGIPLVPDLEYADSRPMMAPIHMASRLKHANATHLRDLAHSLKKPGKHSQEMYIHHFFASSLFCVGRPNRSCHLPTNSVTEPPPGRPSGAAACIVYRGVGVGQPPQNVYGSSILATPDSEEPFFWG